MASLIRRRPAPAVAGSGPRNSDRLDGAICTTNIIAELAAQRIHRIDDGGGSWR